KLDPKKVPPAVRPAKGMPAEVLAVLGRRGDEVDCLAFRPDGRFLAVSGPDQVVRAWAADGPRLVAAARPPHAVVCPAFPPDEPGLVVGDAGGGIRLLTKGETSTPVLKAALAAHADGPVWSVAVGPDGKRPGQGREGVGPDEAEAGGGRGAGRARGRGA